MTGSLRRTPSRMNCKATVVFAGTRNGPARALRAPGRLRQSPLTALVGPGCIRLLYRVLRERDRDAAERRTGLLSFSELSARALGQHGHHDHREDNKRE